MNLTTVTTVARELDEMCEKLHAFSVKSNDESGLSVLGRFFETHDPAELYVIIAEVHKRVSLAHHQIVSVIPDSYEHEPALKALGTIANVFSAATLVQQWVHAPTQLLAPQNLTALRSVSGQIRQDYPVPRLTDAEQAELIEATESLITFIELQNLTEPRVDVQRALMLEGLHVFKTRLQHLRWVGASSTLDALRHFLGAGSALEDAASTSEVAASLVTQCQVFWSKASDIFGIVSKTYTTGKFFVTAWTELGTLLKSPEAQHLFMLTGQEAQKLLESAHQAQKMLTGPS